MKRPTFSHHRGPKALQNATQSLRAQLGLTQDDLAMLLDVSRSAVAMDERGERSLPWPNVQLLHALHLAVLVPAVPPRPFTLTAAARDDLGFRHRGLALEVYPLAQKLERCRVRLAQAQRWQQVLPALRAAFPPDNPLAQQWLGRFERRAAGILRTEAGAPALLQVRLDTIAFELAEIARLLEDGAAPQS